MESRTWFFTHSDSSGKSRLAAILANTTPVRLSKDLEFNIITPGTLVLNNVNQSYDGTYEFVLGVKNQPDDTSTVRVYIAGTFLDLNLILNLYQSNLQLRFDHCMYHV